MKNKELIERIKLILSEGENSGNLENAYFILNSGLYRILEELELEEKKLIEYKESKEFLSMKFALSALVDKSFDECFSEREKSLLMQYEI